MRIFAMGRESKKAAERTIKQPPPRKKARFPPAGGQSGSAVSRCRPSRASSKRAQAKVMTSTAGSRIS